MSIYKKIRNLLFKLDPEQAHHLAQSSLQFLDYVPGAHSVLTSLYEYPSSRFSQTICGIEFPNPIGLAAGFDKNAILCRGMAALGFGFLELGSVTNRPARGNPKPRMFRLPEDRALINRMGLNNVGPYQFLKNYHAASANQNKKYCLPPRLINVAKTNDATIIGDAAIKDMVDCYSLIASSADIVVLNLSCPNSGDGRTFEDPGSLPALLSRISEVKERESFLSPVFVKLSNDIALDDLKHICSISLENGIQGFVMGNTSINRDSLSTDMTVLNDIGNGGLSGEPLFERAISRVAAISEYTNRAVPIIGVGGVSTPKQVIEMLKAGASLVEIYTGLVYEGPGLVKELLEGLEKFLLREGMFSVKELVRGHSY